MIKITKKVEYSLMALNYLNSQDMPVSVKKISEELSLPFDTTSHVLQTLAKAEITKSFKGSLGGHQLIKSLDSIDLLYLSELIENKKIYKDCEEQDCALIENCSIKDPVNNLYEKVSDLFQTIKVSDLLGVKA